MEAILTAIVLSLFIIGMVGVFEMKRLNKENDAYQRELDRSRARRKTEFDMDLVPISGHLPDDVEGENRNLHKPTQGSNAQTDSESR